MVMNDSTRTTYRPVLDPITRLVLGFVVTEGILLLLEGCEPFFERRWSRCTMSFFRVQEAERGKK